MRKYIVLTILLFCLHIAARGQTIISLDDIDLSGLPQPKQAKALRYWFDEDSGSAQTLSNMTGTHSLDVSSLTEGLHTINCQVMDEYDLAAYIGSAIFLKMDNMGSDATAISLRYWFDEEMVSTESVLPGGVSSIDVSALLDGLHTIHYQVVGKDGKVYYVATALFHKSGNSLGSAAVSAKKLMYWFDDDTNIHLLDIGEGVQLLDASGLSEGLHTLHYQVLCNNNQMTPAMSTIFIRVSEDSETVVAKNLRYWFDDEQTATEVAIANGTQMLDASRLLEGLHTVHYQIMDSNGTLGSPASSMFIKMDIDDASATAQSIRYWFDDEQTATEVAIANGTQMLDASRLLEGLHTVHYQIMDSNGTLGSPASSMFLKMDIDDPSATAQSIRYWFDDDATTVQVTNVVNGTQNLDVSALQTGLHTLNYQLIDANGKVGVPETRIFLKNFDKVLADGQNRVTKYQYWLNNNIQTMKTVELSNADNPYTLIALLPMQKEPIRSDCFHYEITDGVPTVYAKNILHIRFHDAAGFFVDGEESFIDYSVKQVISDAELLEPSMHVTTAKPVENAIKWYCLEAEFGDSLQFKLDRAATIQLFTPSGKEVYSSSGAESVKWGGLHVSETGTYYLALHDVTAQQGTTIGLDYQHIDRYAILAYTPKSFGVPSTVNISLEGNGFLDGINVYLSKDETLIKANTLTIEDISHATANFIFDNIQLGEYDLRVVFAETDTITIDEAVSIEEGDSLPDIEIAIEGSPTFMSGGSATYNIRFTNRSNIPVFFMPFTLTIDCNGDISNLPYLKFETDIRQQIRQEMRMAFFDQCTPEELKALEDAVFGDDDLSAFYLDTISVQGKTYLVGDFILPRLDGHSTLTIPFTIKGVRTDLIFYAFIDPHWSITELVNIAKANGGDSGSGSGGSGSGSGDSGSGSGGSGSGSGGSGSGSGGSSIGSGGSGSGSGGSSSGSGGSGSGSGGSGSGSGGSGSGSGGSDGCENPCAIGLAIDCFQSIVESVDVAGSIREAVRSCAGDLIKNSTIKIFSDAICNGKMPDLSEMQKNPKPVVVDITWEYLKCLGMEAAKRILGGRVIKTINIGYNCLYKPLQAWGKRCPDDDGGSSFSPSPVNSWEPNDIIGYVAESGSKAIKEGHTDVFYTIQFENDTVFATAPAHDIYLTDTLDVNLFDLSTYRPTKITIGNKSMELTGERNFISTMDMRPEINAIAQIEGTINDITGIVRWHISSLDPMTMEPSDDPMVGVLPVNFDGSGLGEAFYYISLKSDLPQGTLIPNRSGNIFDNNETVMTPTWTNIIDRIAPESHVTDVQMASDTTATVRIAATDELSGPWRYNVYVQYGSGAWFLGAENVPIDSIALVKVYEGIDHGFYTVVTDSAGNVEQKEALREFTFEVFGSQVDTDTRIELAQGWNWISHNQQEPLPVSALKPSGTRMVGQEEELYNDSRLGWMGDLDELLPTQMYKLQMDEPLTVQLSGLLFNAAFRSVPLYQGWNWIGYPVAHTMTPAEALLKLEAEEGDVILGQDGMTAYSDGLWSGTLTEMVPGQGYMYRSASDKSLFYNATAQASSRRENAQRSMSNVQYPDGWTVDKRKYPSVMGVIAQLYCGHSLAEESQWTVGAFCGDECRGLAQSVDGVLMMNVYGQGGEPIVFRAVNSVTGEVLQATEHEDFRTDVLGTFSLPYMLHIGQATGIVEVDNGMNGTDRTVIYDLQGRQIDNTTVPRTSSSSRNRGVYIQTDGSSAKKTIMRE